MYVFLLCMKGKTLAYGMYKTRSIASFLCYNFQSDKEIESSFKLLENQFTKLLFRQKKMILVSNLKKSDRYGNPFVMFCFLSHIDDLSYNKVATQSHTYPGGAYYSANNAVDGNIATCMRTDIIGMNALAKTVWWKVDLGGLRHIYSINILFKNYSVYGDYKLIY